jgi:hypothetical protein
MAIGSGLGSSFGFSAESAYGTYNAPTKFVRHKSASLQKTATRAQGQGIISGTYGEFLNQFVETVTGGMGTVGFDIQSKNMGLLFQTLMGTTVTPVQQGATTAYLQTHSFGDPFGKSLTMQVGLPQRGGTVTPATLKGCKVSKIDLSCGIDTVLSATATIDAQAYENTTTLASTSYTSNVNVFHGGQLTVKLGTYGSEAAVSGVKNVALSIERAMDTSGYYAGATVAGTKSEPVLNGVAKVSGSVTVDFINATDFHLRARDNSNTSLICTWVGPLIASTYYETFTVAIPAVIFPAPTSFDVADRNVLQNQFAFEARYDGTNPFAQVLITSAESAL